MNKAIKHIGLGIISGAAIYLVIKKHCTPDATAAAGGGDSSDLVGGGGGGFAGVPDLGDSTTDDTTDTTATDTGTTTDTGTDTGTTTGTGAGGTTIINNPPPTSCPAGYTLKNGVCVQNPPATTTPPPNNTPPANIPLTAADFKPTFAHDGKSDIKYTLQYVGATPILGVANVTVNAHFTWHSGVLGKTRPTDMQVSFSMTYDATTQTKKVNYPHDILYSTVVLSVVSVTGNRQGAAAGASGNISIPHAYGADGDLSHLDDASRNFVLGFGKHI